MDGPLFESLKKRLSDLSWQSALIFVPQCVWEGKRVENMYLLHTLFPMRHCSN